MSKRIPKNTKNIPPTLCVHLSTLDNVRTYCDAWPTTSASSKKGIASPREKMKRRNPPAKAVVDVEARNNTEPKIGPMHGVQPSPNVAPIIIELAGLPALKRLRIGIRFVVSKNLIRTIPVINNPKKITKMPPVRESQSRYIASCDPRKPNKTPSKINITENPITKKIPFRKILSFALCDFVGFCKSWIADPLMIPKNPGTSGSVHGARKVNNPAIKEGIIREMSIIVAV